MRSHCSIICSVALFSATVLSGDIRRGRELELSGQIAAAEKEYQADGGLAYAEFLERRRQPAAAAAYEKLASHPDPNVKRQALKRLVVLSLLDGNKPAVERNLNQYHAAGGTDFNFTTSPRAAVSTGISEIPGPIRSFSRMAALSPDLTPDDLLGALARNIVTNGYQAAGNNEGLVQTEYLKLIYRYLSQAKELEKLSKDQHILIEQCDSAQTGELLKVLGYRMRGACGGDLVLETVNASRAFLTIDSGFPLAALEMALKTGKPFNYDYKPTKVTVLYGPTYWSGAKEKDKPEQLFIEQFMSDPQLCRLYLGLSKLDPSTAEDLKTAMPVQRLRAFSHVLDFFGGMLQIRNGKVAVPGDPRSASVWVELVGAHPDNGPAFLEKLIAKDDGWVAAYFESLSRISGPTLDYLTEPTRLRRFYVGLRGKVTSPGPARPVFRASTDLMLLTSRLRLEPNGKPHIPGSVENWRTLFINHPHGKYDGKLTKSAQNWKSPDDLLEALFALSRKAVDNEPLRMFLSLSDVNRNRQIPLSPAAVDRLLKDWKVYGHQYSAFAEMPELSEQSILQYLSAAQTLNGIGDVQFKADSVGIFQSLTSLTQILNRNHLLTVPLDEALAPILTQISAAKNSRELFDAAKTSVKHLLKAAGVDDNADPQQAMLGLLAGAANPSDADTHRALVSEMHRVFDAQRLVSLKMIFDIDENLLAPSNGGKVNVALVNRLSSRIVEQQPPRSSLSGAERNAMAFGYWVDKHIENERKTNFRAILDKAGSDPVKLKDARGQLTGFLRDTLVGFAYIHYAPPGAQILFTNPHFVRSHDFLGVLGTNQTWRNTEVFGSGWPSSAGGRLVGSMVSLPYALAEAEQNFLIPTREQALIWGDLVPQMIVASKVPRYWRVTPTQMHFASLHYRAGESLLAQSAVDEALRAKVIAALARFAPPARTEAVNALLESGRASEALDLVTPSESFNLCLHLIATNDSDMSSPLIAEIRRLKLAMPQELSVAAISQSFGTPKPTLANSYQPQLLSLRTFPTLMGYSSRILAESWESSNIYYAALADELGMKPSELNLQVPQWTKLTVEKIFATHLEDWPALLRSLRLVGQEMRNASKQSQQGSL
ncbi:hypothetical protein [Bryobacter aggregatus]|uniref:hypothetical protein n=1 Tax=Bryobacter aggregatus TaxID=360054 RepID=UPI0012BB0C18|nr:hypothetical protein [Bryobacter aggregatus]